MKRNVVSKMLTPKQSTISLVEFDTLPRPIKELLWDTPIQMEITKDFYENMKYYSISSIVKSLNEAKEKLSSLYTKDIYGEEHPSLQKRNLE